MRGEIVSVEGRSLGKVTSLALLQSTNFVLSLLGDSQKARSSASLANSEMGFNGLLIDTLFFRSDSDPPLPVAGPALGMSHGNDVDLILPIDKNDEKRKFLELNFTRSVQIGGITKRKGHGTGKSC